MNSREQFESWYKREIFRHATLSANPHGQYADPHVQLMWMAWQESRAALKASADEAVADFERHCRLAIGDLKVKV